MNKLQPLIKKLKLDYCNENITDANFPDDGKRGKEFKLYDFKRDISSEDVIAEMEKEGFRPATIHELLIWAEKNWDGKEWVVALGSVWRDPYGNRYVAYLYGWDGKRKLDLRWYGSVWDGCYRFLAFRKVIQTPGPLVSEAKAELPSELVINGIRYVKSNDH